MIVALSIDLREEVILLNAYAGKLRRTQNAGLDSAHDITADSCGRIQIEDAADARFLRSNTGWPEVDTGRR